MVTDSQQRKAPAMPASIREHDRISGGFDMPSLPCPVIGCIRDVLRGGYCYAHYMKNWRYGTPTPSHAPSWIDIRGQRFGSLMVLKRVGFKWECQCDCGNNSQVRAGDLNRGTVASCGDRRIHWRRGDSGYRAAHDRVRRDKGRAVDHECSDCGLPAHQWSYDHDDLNEMHAEGFSKNPIAYSLDSDHYMPRCISCHKTFDLGRINAASTHMR